jgi:acyl-CoA hydrolase
MPERGYVVCTTTRPWSRPVHVVSEQHLSRVLGNLRAEQPRIVASGNAAAPATLLTAVDAAIPAYRLFMLNAPAGLLLRDGVIPETPFVGPGMRGHPLLAYTPCRLSLVPRLITTRLVPDVVVLNTTVPRDGVVSLGIEVNILPAAIEAAHDRGALVVAQLNRSMPYTYGDGQVPVADIDYAVEVDEPLRATTARPSDETHREIGARVASLVGEAATLQAGIGAVPDATLAALSGRTRLRVWTELLSDGVMHLERAGALDGDHPLRTSFAAGSPELYDWIDRNRRLVFSRTEKVNDPARIARQPAMTSINTALQVDLFGQANASYVRDQIHSGFGGQTDFIVGALHATDGNAVVALASWHPKADVSTIVPALRAPATSFQQSYVVTEQGTAPLWGSSQHEQARALIEQAAHPDARDDLRRAAAEAHLL